MDHIPLPDVRNRRNDDDQNINVELLRSLHDGHERVLFLDYPQRWGFTHEQLITGAFPQEDSHRAAAVVQNWLSFGLLEEVFEVSIPETDFTSVRETGQRLLTTSKLHIYGGRWQEHWAGLDETLKKEAATRLKKAFYECSRFFRLFLQGTKSQYPEKFNNFLNPLAVLVETLRHWAIYVIGFGEHPDAMPSTLSSEATEELVSRGWCRHTIANTLFPHNSPSLFAYASLFDKCPSTLGEDHSNCEWNKCAIASVDISTYKTKHNSRYCTEAKGIRCAILIPDINTIKCLLEDDKVPVITFTEDHELKVLPHDERPYIAISHVWADGMGSTSEEGLPECQIRFLSNTAISALNYVEVESGVSTVSEFELGKGCRNEDTPVWVDSLCIPSQGHLRKKAIALMARTYASATAVVVVDGAMLQQSISMPFEQHLFTLRFSKWVRRLWTLQEALLSRKLLVLLDDAMVDILGFFNLDARVQVPAFLELYRWVEKLMGVPIARRKGVEREFLLDDIILQLANRTSSRPTDEVLALAVLFGLDVSQYVDLDAEERMIKFLIEHNGSKVRYDILFLKGPKLLINGFSWAPKTFLNREIDTIVRGRYEGGWAVISDQGLVSKDYYCLLMNNKWSREGFPRDYRVRTDDGEILTIKFSYNIDPDDDDEPEYDALVLQQKLLEGQDCVAAACTILAAEEGNVDIEYKYLRLDLGGFVQVFNDDQNETFNMLPIANDVLSYTSIVCIG